jgi:serine protease AprX
MSVRVVEFAARVLGTVVLAGLVSCSAATSGTRKGQLVADAGPTASYIVEADSTDNAARAVKAAGGHVVSRLGVIDAVEASLTSSQHQAVLAIQGVKQVTPNAPVTTLAAANVRDNFETGSFANNDGTHRWYGDWVEQNDNNSPFNGKVSIGWHDRGGNRMIIGGNGAIYRRAATPANASTVTLKLNYSRASLGPGEYVAVQASSNGGTTWSEVGRISGAGNDSGFTAKSYNITAFRGRNTAIRFAGSMGDTFPGDYVDIDDVEIAYNTTYGEGDPVPVDVNTKKLHAAGIRGRDVGVAVIDTGYWKLNSLDFDSSGVGRVAVQYDAVTNTVVSNWAPVSTDTTGHGTHVTSLIASSRAKSSGEYFGVAPDARIISIKAFGEDGGSSYATVIRAIDYVVTNKNPLAIRVLNLSLGAQARSRYWDDPLNKAVMRAWQSGIVVVVSAGNSGPLPQTVGVPGNVPYVITVGAMTDNYTTNKNDDRLASFSSTGPTFEGFVKPDLVAPGGHLWGFMGTYMKIAVDHPTFMNNGDFFTMSGTSQAAAVVSGVAALVLSKDPSLTPDQVKCRIIASAKPAVNADGTLAYSVLQQGTGLVDADRAVYGTASNCANQGLNINADIAGTQHYLGSVRQQIDGTFKVTSPNGALTDQGFTWDMGYTWELGYTWTNGYTWPMGYTWTLGYTWPMGYDIPWVDGYPANIGSSASTSSPMSINSWVDQE